MACCYARLRESSGQGETDAFPASEVLSRRIYERLVFISRTGTTTEVLEALGAVPVGVPTTAITANGSTPIARAADCSVDLDFADGRSVVDTCFATSVLMLAIAHLGGNPAPMVNQAETVLRQPLPKNWHQVRQFVFLARGWTVGLAQEAALKLREAAQVWAEAYPAMEYRHGPISVADEATLVWCLGAPPQDMEKDVKGVGASFISSELHPLAELVRVQRLAVELAKARGLDPDRPRHLARSVILGSPGGFAKGAR
jgi:fructoselysine-6-P-deglycase FrlB-like protein